MLLLIACTDPEPAPEARPQLVDTAGGADFQRPDPGMDVLEFESELDRVMSPGFPDPTPVAGLYASLMAEGDEDCPGHAQHLSNARQGHGGCTSESGLHYEGISFYLYGDQLEDLSMPDYESFAPAAFRLSGDFRITDADGVPFHGGGVVARVVDGEDEPRRWTIEVNGTWAYEPDNGWIGAQASNRLIVQGTRDGESLSQVLDGGVSREAGSVVFHEVTVGGDCEGFVDGALSMRDEIGAWYTLELNGDCSGCGSLTYDERVDLGLACIHDEEFLEGLARVTP